jgi:hypothetical protein
MYNKLTREEVARVFAMYAYSETKYQANDLITLDLITGAIVDIVKYGHGKLLLTPLDKITDEDAIDVAKIAGYDNDYEIRRVKNGNEIWITKIAGAFRESICLDEMKITNHGYDDAYGHDREYPLPNVIEVIDYLRSKGYALPYKGQSLFGLSLAIQKQ